MTTRRDLLASAALAALGAMPCRAAVAADAGAPHARAAGGWPQRPITLWIPWAAGGNTDNSMRLLAELAGRHLGQKVLVDNRPGAGGTLAMPILQQAAPDGYTLAQLPQPALRLPWVQKTVWDPIRDTTPILQVSGVTFGVLVAAASPVRTLDDLFALAARTPGGLNIATNGIGTTPHVVLDELFARRRLDYVHVPYKGNAEQLLAILTGQVHAGVASTGFAPMVEDGKLRLLAVMSERRGKRWPTVPTLVELGHGIVAQSPFGIVGPRGLPPDVVRALHDAFRAAMHDPAFVADLERYDQTLAYLGSDDYGRALREAYAAEKRAVERLGLAARRD